MNKIGQRCALHQYLLGCFPDVVYFCFLLSWKMEQKNINILFKSLAALTNQLSVAFIRFRLFLIYIETV